MALVLRRALSGVEEPARYEKLVAERPGRSSVKIPWASFVRARHPAAVLALATDAQTKLAWGEYGAIEIFARIASAAARLGVPFDLVAAACRIPADEMRHADQALRFAELLHGGPVTWTVDARELPRWPADVSFEELDALVAEVSAVGETLAFALLDACRKLARDPVAKAHYGAIVADELHHARFGWRYLAWRAPQWTMAERQRIADRVGQMVADAESRFAHGRDAPRGQVKAAHALGVLDTKGQRLTVRRVFEDEIVPGLDALGLGASYAWKKRSRAAKERS
jgi:1,2-phenylacetyl-CoA epoxidase catalytic subunit